MNGLVLLTALVPTIGHQFLVDFASNFMNARNGDLHVLISMRSFEPVHGSLRILAFKKQFKSYLNIKFYPHVDNNAPQTDDGTQEFWDYWVNTVKRITKVNIDFVFASEHYGLETAKQLNAEFIPCDTNRFIIPVKGTPVRNQLFENFHNIMPAFRSQLMSNITFFGAESTGKTTMSRKFSELKNGTWKPEWARTYLESVGNEITDEKMKNIRDGEYSILNSISNVAAKPLVFQDTDLITTYGYTKLYNPNADLSILEDFIKNTKSNLYIVMNSKIPFTPDPLRYGGNIRESDDLYWIDLLEQFHCNYHVVQQTEYENQIQEIDKVIEDFIDKKYGPISKFVRD
jgi:HTH-type transcriptional regulator, transcriptional repressor of NAD biosynthesis genes